MYISEETINEIREKNDIVDVISGYVKLKKQGSNYFGICPFHTEKSASFCVSQSKQMFKCFGCDKGGNVFSFVSEYENITFPEAVKQLGERVGVTITQREPDEREKREKSLRARLISLNKEAATYYYFRLRDKPDNAGRRYFINRGLSEETMSKFGLGFAPVKSGLIAELKKKGYTDEEMLAAGVAVHNEKYGLSEKFWNRVIFPIMDVRGRVLGFGGRVMGEGKPKYLNSPETVIFEKRKNLYGLNIARNSHKDHLILCEGYMDVIAMHQAGFDQAVASLGTALTMDHVRIVARMVKKVLLIYDSDNAGVSAALRAIPLCRQAGLSCKVVDLSSCKDPDEFIQKHGAGEFQKRLDDAKNSVYFELDVKRRGFNLAEPDEATAFFREVAKAVAVMEDELERENYIRALSKRYDIPSASLEREVVKITAKNEGIEIPDEVRSGISLFRQEKESSLLTAQRYLLTALADDPVIFPQVARYVSPKDFDEGIARQVAFSLFDQLKDGRANPAAIVDMYYESCDRDYAARLLGSKYEGAREGADYENFITDLIVKLVKNRDSGGGPDEGTVEADPIAGARIKARERDDLKNIHISLKER